ncbi:MAG: acyl-CoA dehydrogenase [Burkholderiaceae bacterium]|nr:MAG: acyl-CoA dehydrogenase [Burkholderiaceae bacterium]
MPSFSPPLRDLAFVLHDLLGAPAALAALPQHAEVSAELLDQIAQEAGRFAAEKILPLNPGADKIGCLWSDGKVAAPPGFVQAYDEFCELGWPSMCADIDDGGQALPRLVFSVVGEMLSSCSHAFVMYAAVNHCAASCLRNSASEALRKQWLAPLANGQVTTSMCMTEAQAGSDIGLLSTRATATDDGHFLITGNKIFASGAEHDLTPNIMHLVLARLAGAPAGSRGLSLFLVPKLLSDGTHNTVHCDGIEHKMGLHGSPTCSMRFEQAQGWLVGEPNQGLRAMFPMMNEARLLSGLQAVGLSEQALQNSLEYARERRQGRSASGPGPCAIIEHPDVQRMLLTQKAWTEGARAFVHWVALLLDVAQWHPDADIRNDTASLVEFLTPLVKGFLTENAQQSISAAIQIHGGHGYIAETGIEQLARDARITTIYEGTTGIQAQDLLLRKVLGDGGQRLALLQERVQAWLTLQAEQAHMQEFVQPLNAAMQSVNEATALLSQREQTQAGSSLAVSTHYLRLAGHLVFAFLWAQAAVAAWEAAQQGSAWHKAKLTTARFYFSQLLPESSHLMAAIAAEPLNMEAAFEAA